MLVVPKPAVKLLVVLKPVVQSLVVLKPAELPVALKPVVQPLAALKPAGKLWVVQRLAAPSMERAWWLRLRACLIWLGEAYLQTVWAWRAVESLAAKLDPQANASKT